VKKAVLFQIVFILAVLVLLCTSVDPLAEHVDWLSQVRDVGGLVLCRTHAAIERCDALALVAVVVRAILAHVSGPEIRQALATLQRT